MFQPTNFTLTNVFLATKEQALQDAHKFLKQVTGFVTVNRIDNTVKTGSAFFFCNSFHLLTAAHVVQDASSISVTFPDHGIFNATVIRSDTRLDLALLHMTELEGQMHSLPYLKLAPQELLHFVLVSTSLGCTVPKALSRIAMILILLLYQISPIMELVVALQLVGFSVIC